MTASDDAARPLVIVGCGRIVELGHAPALAASPDFEVTGLVDPSAARRNAILSLLNGAPPAVVSPCISDAPVDGAIVLLATPSRLRDELVAEVLAAGAEAVLIEKPLGISVATAESVLRRTRMRRTPLIPVHNQFCEPAFARVLDVARTGRLGTIKEVCVTHRMTEPFAGAWPGREDWRVQTTLGCLLDLGYQALCLALSVTGTDIVSGRCSAQWSGGPVKAISTADLSLDHHDGARSRVLVSWESESPCHQLKVIGENGEVEGRNDGKVVTNIHGKMSYEALPAGLEVMFSDWYRQTSEKLCGDANYNEAERAVEVIKVLSQVGEETAVMESPQAGRTHGEASE